VTRSVGCDACILSRDPRRFRSCPQPLPLLPNCFERLTMLVANLTRFLGQSPELFRLIPARLGRNAVSFCDPTVLLGILTAVLSPVAQALGLLPVML
jgi:hypothetical protein